MQVALVTGPIQTIVCGQHREDRKKRYRYLNRLIGYMPIEKKNTEFETNRYSLTAQQPESFMSASQFNFEPELPNRLTDG